MTLAYSYLRFSSPQQATGDSVRRQTENRENWLAAHPHVRLDQSLVMTDAGRSAFRRKNWDTYALAQFVECIKAGRVEPGSYLLVENLDRLSREDAGEATELFLSIVNKGIIVVQLSPVVMEFRRPVNVQSLMFAIVELSRGHSESALKSERVGAAWARKRKNAAKEVLTRRVPVWIRYQDGKLTVDPVAAATMRRLFRLARDGYGVSAIAAKLNALGVPVLGRKTYKGRPVLWAGPTVYFLLTTRAVLGEYQPMKAEAGKRQPCGDPIPNYYPPVIDRELYYAVQGMLKARAVLGPGRRGLHVNLFAGLLVDARNGGTLTYKRDGTRPQALIPIGAKHGHGIDWTSFPSELFDEALLSLLPEVPASDLWGNGDTAHKVETLAGQLAETDTLLKLWATKMDDPARVDLVAEKLAALNRKRKQLAQQMAQAQREAANPLSESWGEFRSLAELLRKNPSDELRIRARAALRRAIESVTCLFVKVRGARWAAVQIRFRRTNRRRDYVILAQRSPGQPRRRRLDQWQAKSLADIPGAGDLDLRKPTHARKLEAVLAALDPQAV
jgi:DNA invertase Pin-like site-specific DNA recombinase